MNLTKSDADILSFPFEKNAEKEIIIPRTEGVLLDTEEIEILQEKPEQREKKALDAYLDRTLRDFNLPPFVLKMRKVSSIHNQIDHVKKLSKEIDYYLNEIELYSKS